MSGTENRGRIWYLVEAKRLEAADMAMAMALEAILTEAMNKIHALPEPLIPDRWPTDGFDRETTLGLLSDLLPNNAWTLRKAAEELALTREQDGTALQRAAFITIPEDV